METYLLENFTNLAGYVDLSDSFARQAMQTLIAKKLRENGFISNHSASLRIAIAFIDTNIKGN